MSEINYKGMSDRQLKKYLFEYQSKEITLQEYLSRRHQNIKLIITKIDDPNFYLKIQESICQQINQAKVN